MNIKNIIYSFVVVLVLGMPAVVLASAELTGFGTVQAFEGTSTGTLIPAIRKIVNALLGLAAVVAVIFVIIGGVRYIASQGDEDAAVQAKGTILYALLGLIVIALSAVLVNFIIKSI